MTTITSLFKQTKLINFDGLKFTEKIPSRLASHFIAGLEGKVFTGRPKFIKQRELSGEWLPEVDTSESFAFYNLGLQRRTKIKKGEFQLTETGYALF